MSERTAAVLYPLLACNARCPFCTTRVYTDTGPVSTEDFARGITRKIADYTLPFEEAKEHYRGFASSVVQTVHLQGGEPTAYERLPELIEFGRELGIREQIVVTNGRRLSDASFARRLVDAGVSTLALSVFGPNAAIHDESMGAPGAFDDLVNGVERVMSLRKDAGHPHVTAQLIVHARNVAALPDTFQRFRALGVRTFGFRLLRESPNLGPDGDGWFFDLADLRAPLERTLDLAAADAETRVSFPEIFYCLVGPRYLGFVLGDLATNERLRVGKSVEDRHRRSLTTLAHRRVSEGTECDACELASACVKLEAFHRPRFTGSFTALHVASDAEALLADANVPPQLLAVLLRQAAQARAFGVGEATLARLRARLAKTDPEAVFEDRAGLDRAREARKPGGVTRFLPLSELGEKGLLEGGARATLSRCATATDGATREKAAFLRKLALLADEPLVAVFSGELSGPRPYRVALYADELVTPETLSAAFDAE